MFIPPDNTDVSSINIGPALPVLFAVVVVAVVAYLVYLAVSPWLRRVGIVLVLQPPRGAAGTQATPGAVSSGGRQAGWDVSDGPLYFPGERLVLGVKAPRAVKGDRVVLRLEARHVDSSVGELPREAGAGGIAPGPTAAGPGPAGAGGGAGAGAGTVGTVSALAAGSPPPFVHSVPIPSPTCEVTFNPVPWPGLYCIEYHDAQGDVVKSMTVHVVAPRVAAARAPGGPSAPAGGPLVWGCPLAAQFSTSSTHDSYDQVALVRVRALEPEEVVGGGRDGADAGEDVSLGDGRACVTVDTLYVPKGLAQGTVDFPKGAPEPG